jgi:translation initiation factor 3 subunit A
MRERESQRECKRER